MTLQEMEDREAKYQSMIDDVLACRNVSHVIGSDWGFNLPVAATKIDFARKAHQLFCKKFGDVTNTMFHQNRGFV